MAEHLQIGWGSRAGLPEEEYGKRIHKLDIECEQIDPSEPRVVWLGHASFAVRWHGVRILIDPVFAKRIGVFSRLIPQPRLADLKGYDIALISHGHMDHLDNASLASVSAQTIMLPMNTERFLSARVKRASEVRTFAFGEVIRHGPLSIESVYALHGGWRYPWQKGYWACGYIISDGEKTVYYAGDTAYGAHFKQIDSDVDIALLPIGAYSPQWFLQSRHLNPVEAVQAFMDIGAKRFIPFHFGTYRLSLERPDEPMRWFVALAREKGIEWELPIGIL